VSIIAAEAKKMTLPAGDAEVARAKTQLHSMVHCALKHALSHT
jgi:hypothetical protein